MSHWRIEHGDCRELLASVSDASVQCVVTSPPYWGLRDYGTATWEGGDSTCQHVAGFSRRDAARVRPTAGNTRGGSGSQAVALFRGDCQTCGARRCDSQLGLEPTPDAYVEQMVTVFQDVRRVLREDGTLWLVLGDSYAANRSYQVPSTNGGVKHSLARGNQSSNSIPLGLKSKDLIGIPWRVAFALQADGWYLRSDIIWAKPNPMPESVTDRPTKAHEYVFLLTKSAKYFYDTEAIREASTDAIGKSRGGSLSRFGRDEKLISSNAHRGDKKPVSNGWANKRSVWTISPQPYAGAHFATMPEELAQTCILAGSRRGDLVLDPFCGAGTTGLVACRLGRRFLGFDLNASYCDLARRRIEDSAPLFLRETPA